MSEFNIISIPVLFDIGGGATVFGEEGLSDFVTSHLDFVLDMTTEVNDISLNAADISSAILIGDQDTGDNIFYSGGANGNIGVDNLCNRIAKAITRGKLVHLPKSGDYSNSGIPIGGRANLTNNLGELGSQYTAKYLTSIAPIGDEQMLGQAMARVASIHLVGSPLPAGIFEDQNQIQTDLEIASAQTFNSGNTAFYNALAVQLSKVLGGSKSSAPMNPAGDLITTYINVDTTAFDITKVVTTKLATIELENQLKSDLTPSLKIVTGNTDAVFTTGGVQSIAANHANAQNFPRGYFTKTNMDSATTNQYEIYFNYSTTSTATGMAVGHAHSGNLGWGVMEESTPAKPLDASGTSVPALKSIYEQLMNVPGRSQIMETRDIGGVVDNSNVTLSGGFPFIAGDKLVMYIRPKIVFANQTKAQQNTSLITASGPIATTIDVPVYDIGRKSTAGGAISGQVYTESSSHDDGATWAFHKCFEGDSTDDEEWTTSGDVNHQYSTTSPYDYIGDQKTINIDGSSELLGEWGQIDIGQNTVINKFQIWPRPSYRDSRSPSDFSLLGSLDGTNWTTIKAVSGLVANDWATNNGNTPAGTNTWELGSVHGPYRYYRLSVSSRVGVGDGRLSLTGLLLYGAKSPSEVTTGSSGSVTDISGLTTNIVATAENIEDAFPGNTTTGPEPEINKWGWMGSPNSDSLSLETTDITTETTCDLHIWKITITL